MKIVVSILKFVGVAIVIFVALNLVGIWLQMTSPFGGYDLVWWHLVAGFVLFLRDSLAAGSYDAGTWGPGVAAFVIALLIAHRFLSAWAVRTKRHWSFWTSLCLMLLLPALFTIAFIIPGILLQWEVLREGPWISVR